MEDEKYFSDYGTSRSELMVQCGFVKKSAQEKYEKGKNGFQLKGTEGKVSSDDADEEEVLF